MAITLSSDNLMEQVEEGEQSLESSARGTKVNLLEVDHPYQDSQASIPMAPEGHNAQMYDAPAISQIEPVTRVVEASPAPKKKASIKPDTENKELVRTHQLQPEKEKLYNERKAGTQRAEAALKEQQK